MIMRISIFLLAVCITTSVFAAGQDVASLKAACDAAREQRLAPERDALIKECIAKGEKEDRCKRYYSDHGDGGRTAAGGRRPPKYSDLPECQALEKAENSGSKR